jgi:membrane-associated phospholipid phosphatase
MPASLTKIHARLFPNGILDAARQILIVVGAYYAYRLVRGAVDGHANIAYENGRWIIDLERSTHTFIEPAVQQWTEAKPWLIDFASWMYVNSHFTLTVSSMVFIYLFRNDSFYFIRNMFVISMAIALVGYMLMPTAPPRFFPEWGFQDSVASFTGVDAKDVTVNALFNPYAAVPSMHVGFALMLAVPMIRMAKRSWVKVLWTVYPLIVSFVVVSTGNHWIFDVVTGAMTAALAALGAQFLLARARPNAWAFRPEPARAGATA